MKCFLQKIFQSKKWPDELETVKMYSAIREDTTKYLGKETPLDNSNIYSGIQWENENSKVMLISFAQNDEFAVQVSYLLKEEKSSMH